MPYSIATVLTPKVPKVTSIDVGFRSASESGRSSGTGYVPEERLMLTGVEKICNIVVSVFV